MKRPDSWLTGLRWMGGLAVLAFALSAFTPLWNVIGGYVAPRPDLRPADAIVVLGAGMLPDGSLGNESLRRTMHGLELYKRGLAPILVLSGPPYQRFSSPSEAEVRKQIAMRMEIPADRILVVSNVLTTRDESQEISAALGKLHAKTVLLVTEPLHMPRAVGLFQRAGLETFAAPSDNFPQIAVSPEARLLLMWRVLMQLGGMAYYRVVGYI